MRAASSIYGDARSYLERSTGRYRRGEDEYYARLALEQAVRAAVAGNFGIGAVAVVRGPVVREYRAGNALFTGVGVVDHAEVRALLKWREGESPDDEYEVADLETPASVPEGVTVFATVEPCPMCACALTHVNAARSVSTHVDGDLVVVDGQQSIDGAAAAIGPKQRLQPSRWREIQEAQGLEFTLLETEDAELRDLSYQVWKASEQELVSKLASAGTAASG